MNNKDTNSQSDIKPVVRIDSFEQELISQLKSEGWFDESYLNDPEIIFNWVRLEKDTKKKIYWYTRASELDHSTAQFFLALEYINGKNIKQDLKTGIYLLKKSAELENKYACYQLGKLYISGKLISQDIEKGMNVIVIVIEIDVDDNIDPGTFATKELDTLTIPTSESDYDNDSD